MSFIDKLTFKFQNLFRFQKLNSNDFNLDEGIEVNFDNIELFKNCIKNHEELKEVIWIGIYHSLNTFNSDKEFLTVLNNDFLIIADLIEGDNTSVDIPDFVKKQILDGNVLATFHNHFNGAIIPSSKDIKNTMLPFIKFMVITSKENIGIIVNDNKNVGDDFINSFKQEWMFFLAFINWSFNKDMSDQIQQIYDLNLTKKEKQMEEQILFDKYISTNINKFRKEFNSRMEKFNVCLLQIIIMER